MTGHTAMHAVPKTARRILALVAALATLLALFGGLSLAPKQAHAAGPYTVTFDANPGGHFASIPAGKDSTDPHNHVYSASAASTFTLTTDADGNVTAAQLKTLPNAFNKASASSMLVATSWNTKADGSGVTLDMSGFQVSSNVTFYPIWSDADVLNIYASVTDIAGIESFTGFRPWRNVPGIQPTNSGLVTLYGRDKDEIDLNPYWSYMHANYWNPTDYTNDSNRFVAFANSIERVDYDSGYLEKNAGFNPAPSGGKTIVYFTSYRFHTSSETLYGADVHHDVSGGSGSPTTNLTIYFEIGEGRETSKFPSSIMLANSCIVSLRNPYEFLCGGDLIDAISKLTPTYDDFIGWATYPQSAHSTWTQEQAQTANLSSLPGMIHNGIYMPIPFGPYWRDESRNNGKIYYDPDQSTPSRSAYIPVLFAWYGHTLTLDANGGRFPDGSNSRTITSDKDGHVQRSVIAEASYVPTREHYTFEGWYPVREANGDVSGTRVRTTGADPIILGSNTTYYAKWKKNPVLTFDAHTNGGSIGSLNSVRVYSDCDSAGNNCSVPSSRMNVTATKSGAKFTGWNSQADGSGTTLDTSTAHPMSGDETWYAQYRAYQYKVIFHAGSGGQVLSLKNVMATDPSAKWEQEGPDYAASEDATHPFTSDASDASNLSGENTSVTPNVQRLGGTYRAEMPAGTHTYNRTEPDGTHHSVTVSDNRLFEGWSTANPATVAGRVSLPARLPLASGESAWPANLSSLTADGSGDLYALYSSVSFDLNDQDPDSRYRGQAVMDSPSSGDAGGFPSAHWIGHVFLGWRAENPDTGVPIETSMTCIPGATDQDVSETINGTTGTVHVYGCGSLASQTGTTVYQAQWQDVRYKIHYVDGKLGSTLYRLDEDATDPTDNEMGRGYIRLDNEAHQTWVKTPMKIDPTVMDPSATDHTVSDKYAPYHLVLWVEYKWSNFQRRGRTPDSTAAPTDNLYPGGWNSSGDPVKTEVAAGDKYYIDPQPTDWQKLDASHLTMSQLGPVRTIYLYGVFGKGVHHLPSAGGTDRSLLLMAPLMLLLLVLGASIARRRSLVPVASEHQPLHVAPRARHAA